MSQKRDMGHPALRVVVALADVGHPPMKTGLEIALWVGGAVVLLLVLWNARLQWRLRQHRGMSKADFLTYFAERGFPQEIVAAIYDYYRSQGVWRSFSIGPEDEIAKLFNQADDGIEDDFIVVLKKLCLERPYDSAWDSWGDVPVKTVEDFVRLVSWAAKNQPSGSMAGAS